MREMTIYFAYDNTEFYDKYECMEYEKHVWDVINELMECYVCFDKNFNMFQPPVTDNLEEMLDFISSTFNNCDIIHFTKNPSDEAKKFQQTEWGYVLPENIEFGYYKYDYHKSDWILLTERNNYNEN